MFPGLTRTNVPNVSRLRIEVGRDGCVGQSLAAQGSNLNHVHIREFCKMRLCPNGVRLSSENAPRMAQIVRYGQIFQIVRRIIQRLAVLMIHREMIRSRADKCGGDQVTFLNQSPLIFSTSRHRKSQIASVQHTANRSISIDMPHITKRTSFIAIAIARYRSPRFRHLLMLLQHADTNY